MTEPEKEKLLEMQSILYSTEVSFEVSLHSFSSRNTYRSSHDVGWVRSTRRRRRRRCFRSGRGRRNFLISSSSFQLSASFQRTSQPFGPFNFINPVTIPCYFQFFSNLFFLNFLFYLHSLNIIFAFSTTTTSSGLLFFYGSLYFLSFVCFLLPLKQN